MTTHPTFSFFSLSSLYLLIHHSQVQSTSSSKGKIFRTSACFFFWLIVAYCVEDMTYDIAGSMSFGLSTYFITIISAGYFFPLALNSGGGESVFCFSLRSDFRHFAASGEAKDPRWDEHRFLDHRSPAGQIRQFILSKLKWEMEGL